MQTLRIDNLFPKALGLISLERPLTYEELSTINNLEKTKNLGNRISINYNVLDLPELKEIKEFCKENLDTYFREVYKPANPTLNLKITQSWVNFSDPGEYHHKHTHGNSIVSGVFYIKTNHADRINFHRAWGDPPEFNFLYETKEFNLFNSETYWYTVEDCMLLLFPSTVSHSVNPLPDNAKTRISLSFNTFYEGALGDPNTKSGLMLKLL